MRIQAIKCPRCKDIIYSRARHDFHRCSCGDIFVDGGFDYLRYSGKAELVSIELSVTKKQLLDDWNCAQDRYGIIKGTNNA